MAKSFTDPKNWTMSNGMLMLEGSKHPDFEVPVHWIIACDSQLERDKKYRKDKLVHSMFQTVLLWESEQDKTKRANKLGCQVRAHIGIELGYLDWLESNE